MKKFSRILVILLAGCMILSGCGASGNKKAATEAESTGAEGSSLLSGVYTAEITIKDYGTVRFDMDAGKAPITVTNFVTLAKSGFYDGLTFHRIIDQFMIQGGDPKGNGTGGSEQKIKGEFTANGVDNKQSHTRGAVSMARSSDMNSASSQFFIVQKDSKYLDGQYACFGYVSEGMDVVDAICKNTPVVDNNGTVKPENQPVIESIRILTGE